MSRNLSGRGSVTIPLGPGKRPVENTFVSLYISKVNIYKLVKSPNFSISMTMGQVTAHE